MRIEPTEIEALLIAVTGDIAQSVFLKADNFVPAHMTRTKAQGKDTFTRDWWCHYLLQECYTNGLPLARGETINMFIGDALHHSWIMHYQVTKVGDRYAFKRIN